MADIPAISAIIIVLNGEAFLREAIQSIRYQTETDWELIIVDDGSSDGTPDIIAQAMAEDSRISAICHPDRENRGMSASRNLGITAARGRYVAFLDADDVWSADKLASQRKVLDADATLAMTYGRVRIWHSWASGNPADDFFYDLGVEPGRAYDPPVLFAQLMENRCQSPTSCGSLIRCDAIMEVGGFDPHFRHLFEDQVFYARLLARHRVYVMDDCVASYRSHDEACTARMSDALPLAAAHLRYLAATGRYLRQRGFADRAKMRAISRARHHVWKQAAKTVLRSGLSRIRRRG